VGVATLSACSGNAEEPIRVQGMIAFPPKDTVRFALPATMHGCTDRHSVILEGLSPEGTGVLVRLRFRDSLVSGTYPITALGDTVTAPGANAAVRYLLHDVTHQMVFDTGSAQVRRAGDRVDTRVTGAGLENAIRTPARVEFHDVPVAGTRDTVPCNYHI
jgi:hypothetical protein